MLEIALKAFTFFLLVYGVRNIAQWVGLLFRTESYKKKVFLLLEPSLSLLYSGSDKVNWQYYCKTVSTLKETKSI